jgi:hypothetical protein
LPGQGVATTYQPLNIHTQPALSSPSFVQLKENEKFDVLRSVLLPRTDAPRTPLIPPTPKKAKGLPKKPKSAPKYPVPPMPPPPALPPNWVELSHTERADAADAAADAEAKPVHVDGWSLVRAAGGQTGWVLTRLAYMAIPDEVAQYAEGRRIVSYFAIGETSDGDQKKKTWLWTTTSDSHASWDFDNVRVFVWSLRHHRYETAFVDRTIKGYSPVLVQEVNYTGKPLAGKYTGFSVCIDKKDGTRARRVYALIGQSVRFAGEQACEPPAPIVVQAPTPLPVTAEAPPAPQAKEGLFERLKRRFKK